MLGRSETETRHSGRCSSSEESSSSLFQECLTDWKFLKLMSPEQNVEIPIMCSHPPYMPWEPQVFGGLQQSLSCHVCDEGTRITGAIILPTTVSKARMGLKEKGLPLKPQHILFCFCQDCVGEFLQSLCPHFVAPASEGFTAWFSPIFLYP